MRINLSDAVDDVAPPKPPCFRSRLEWIGYLRAGAAAQNQKNEPTVILVVNGTPRFNKAFPMCDDCTKWHKLEMSRQDRCEPDYLKDLP